MVSIRSKECCHSFLALYNVLQPTRTQRIFPLGRYLFLFPFFNHFSLYSLFQDVFKLIRGLRTKFRHYGNQGTEKLTAIHPGSLGLGLYVDAGVKFFGPAGLLDKR